MEPTLRATEAPSQMRRRHQAETLFLAAALISLLLSVTLWFTESRLEAVFVGLWVPSVLSLGSFYFARFGGGRRWRS